MSYKKLVENNALLREKSLLYVVATCARDYMIVTSYGNLSELLINRRN